MKTYDWWEGWVIQNLNHPPPFKLYTNESFNMMLQDLSERVYDDYKNFDERK